MTIKIRDNQDIVGTLSVSGMGLFQKSYEANTAVGALLDSAYPVLRWRETDARVTFVIIETDGTNHILANASTYNIPSHGKSLVTHYCGVSGAVLASPPAETSAYNRCPVYRPVDANNVSVLVGVSPRPAAIPNNTETTGYILLYEVNHTSLAATNYDIDTINSFYFKHIKVEAFLVDKSGNSTVKTLMMRIQDDNGTNYTYQRLYGTSGDVRGASTTSTAGIEVTSVCTGTTVNATTSMAVLFGSIWNNGNARSFIRQATEGFSSTWQATIRTYVWNNTTQDINKLTFIVPAGINCVIRLYGSKQVF